MLLAGGSGDRPDREGVVRMLALGVSLVTFVATLVLWWMFDPASADYQFVERHAWMPAFGIQYLIGVDGISLFLVVLTGFLTPLALLSSWDSVHKSVKMFAFFLLALESSMLGVFVAIDLFLFYMFWDFVLIPMYFLIGIWGYDRRVYAAVKFILYTMAGSVLMLVAIIGLAWAYAGGEWHAELQPARPADADAVVADGAMVLPRVCRRVSHQGAAVPVPHVASRCARRSADRRLGDSGRRHAEDGHLRSRSLRISAVPVGGDALRSVDCGVRGDRDHLWRARRDGAAGSEKAGRVFERQPPRIRRPRACAR